jgi:hypothetical protein
LQLQTPFVQQPGPGPNAFPRIVAWPVTSQFASCDIQLGNDLLPFHSPISLPSAVVIDLKFCSQNVRTLAGYNPANPPAIPPYIDLMFSPRGMITGPIAAQGPLHFFLRDLQDATATSSFQDAAGNPCGGLIVGPDPRGPAPAGQIPPLQWGAQDPNNSDRLILTVFPQTGLVSTFEMDKTDANGDGLADNPFNFAQQGKSAGR